MLEIIDAFLLRQAQRFTDWFQDWTGLTKFWLQKAAHISWALSLTAAWVANDDRSPVEALLVCVILSVTALATFVISWDESNFLRNGSLRCSTMLDSRSRVLYLLIFTTFAIGDFLQALHQQETLRNALNGMAWVSYVLMIYFAACTPKPPGKSRLRQLREKLQERLKSITSPVPEPTPA